jgi:hypothetical protein
MSFRANRTPLAGMLPRVIRSPGGIVVVCSCPVAWLVLRRRYARAGWSGSVRPCCAHGRTGKESKKSAKLGRGLDLGFRDKPRPGSRSKLTAQQRAQVP